MGSLKCVVTERTLIFFFFKNLELLLKGRKLRKMKLKAKEKLNYIIGEVYYKKKLFLMVLCIKIWFHKLELWITCELYNKLIC